ncbi:MAG: hypothetical protein IJL52_10225, partial [Clostridia bacterium]|nr:hypothetical protein [Clostridia bacterium]
LLPFVFSNHFITLFLPLLYHFFLPFSTKKQSPLVYCGLCQQSENSPPDCFLNAATVLQEITSYNSEQFLQFAGTAFCGTELRVLAAQPLRLQRKTVHRTVF